MKSILLLAFMAISVLSAHAGKRMVAPQTAICDEELKMKRRQEVAVQKYISLLKIGLADREISTKDLLWIEGQSAPVLPEIETKLETFNLLQGFRRLLPYLTTEHWTEIRAQCVNLRQQQSQLDQAVDESKEKTKNIYNYILRHFDLDANQYAITFEASTGELFTVSRASDGTYLYQVAARKRKKLNYRTDYGKSESFFETSSGEVFLAIVTATHLEVINARTYRPKRRYPLSAIDGYMRSRIKNDISFEPIMFETKIRNKNHFMVALVNEHFDSVKTEKYTGVPMPYAVIDLKTGDKDEGELPSAGYKFARLENGKVYAYGIPVDTNQSKEPVLIHDLMGGTVFSKVMKGIPNFDSPLLYLDSNGDPQMLANEYHLNQRAEKFEKRKGIGAIVSRLAKVYKDKEGIPVLAALEYGKGKSFLLLQPLEGEKPPTRQEIKARAGPSGLLRVNLTRNSQGVLVTLLEAFSGEIVAIHIYEVESRGYFTLPTPDIGGTSPPFFSPRENRVYHFARFKDFGEPLRLFQLWGPDFL